MKSIALPYSNVFSDFLEILRLRNCDLKTTHKAFVACTFPLFFDKVSRNSFISTDIWTHATYSTCDLMKFSPAPEGLRAINFCSCVDMPLAM